MVVDFCFSGRPSNNGSVENRKHLGGIQDFTAEASGEYKQLKKEKGMIRHKFQCSM
jgi:hypothetical protein